MAGHNKKCKDYDRFWVMPVRITLVRVCVCWVGVERRGGVEDRGGEGGNSKCWWMTRNRDNSSTRQLIDIVFGDNSSTQLKTTHRHFLKTIH